jgi:hypothetical protein
MTFDEWWATRALSGKSALPLLVESIRLECKLAWEESRRYNQPEDKDIKAMFDGFCTDVEQCPLTYADCYATIKHLQACIAKLREQSTPQHGGETK